MAECAKTDSEAFFRAIRDGATEELEAMLQASPALVGSKHPDGLTPLRLAVECDREEAVGVLLRRGADPDSAFGDALIGGNAAIVHRFLEAGVDPCIRLDNGMPGASVPAEQGEIDILRDLLEHGLDSNLADSGGTTLLHSACASCETESVRVLLEHGADVHSRDNEGRTPLHDAETIEQVELLLAAGADPEVADANGVTPLMKALRGQPGWSTQKIDDEGNVVWTIDLHAESRAISELLAGRVDRDALTLPEAAGLGNNDRVRELLAEAPSSVDRPDPLGRTPMVHAIINGREETVKLLLQAGADVRGPEPDREPPLLAASEAGDAGIVRMLLAHGADPNDADDIGRTALHEAAGRGLPEVVEILLAAGANPCCADSDGETPLHEAVRRSAECVRMLLRAGADVNAKGFMDGPPLGGVSPDHPEIAVLLLEAGADPGIRELRGRPPGPVGTPLALAAIHDQMPVAKAILDFRGVEAVSSFELAAMDEADALEKRLADNPAMLHERDEIWKGRSLLHYAAAAGAERVTRLLLERGLPVDVRNDDGETPLHLAAVQGRLAVARLLLEHGADVNARDSCYDSTPLHLACSRLWERARAPTKLFLEHGADVNAVSYISQAYPNGCTALDVAEGRRTRVLLRRHGALWASAFGEQETEAS